MMKDIAGRYPWINEHRMEDAANAPAIQEELEHQVKGIVLEPIGGGCLARTQSIEGLWASGSVVIPSSANWLGGGDGFVAEHLGFDGLGLRSDDQVSVSSLALVHFNQLNRESSWFEMMKKLARDRR
jgi:phage terminase large subunit-like protein